MTHPIDRLRHLMHADPVAFDRYVIMLSRRNEHEALRRVARTLIAVGHDPAIEVAGEVLPVIVDANNHIMDALRYAGEKMRRAMTVF